MKINRTTRVRCQALFTAILFLAGNSVIAQNDRFNCLTAGDQQWTGFFIDRDGSNITNYSSYIIKLSIAGKQYTLKPNESVSGSWINQHTRMENCDSITCDGYLLTNMQSAVYSRNETEKFVSDLPTPKSIAECNQQIAAITTKIKEFRNWKTKTSPQFWEYIQGALYEGAWERKIRGIEEQKKY